MASLLLHKPCACCSPEKWVLWGYPERSPSPATHGCSCLLMQPGVCWEPGPGDLNPIHQVTPSTAERACVPTETTLLTFQYLALKLVLPHPLPSISSYCIQVQTQWLFSTQRLGIRWIKQTQAGESTEKQWREELPGLPEVPQPLVQSPALGLHETSLQP